MLTVLLLLCTRETVDIVTAFSSKLYISRSNTTGNISLDSKHCSSVAIGLAKEEVSLKLSGPMYTGLTA